MPKQNKGRPVLVVLIAGIGDLVCASKSLRAIKKAFPDSDLHLLTSSDAAPIARNYPYIDHIWVFPIRELRRSAAPLLDAARVLRDLRKYRYAMVMNLYAVCSLCGALGMGLLLSLVRAHARIGHANKGFGLFVNKKVPHATVAGRHSVDAMMSIALAAGARDDGRGIDVFWDKGCEGQWHDLFKEPRPVIAINPGGDRPNRRWREDRFAETADRLVDRCGGRILILGGPADRERAGRIRRAMKNAATDLSGRLSLDALAFIISKADLLVTNDSAAMHIAAALQTRQVAIFGPEDPKLFHPYAQANTYRIIRKEIGCNPCSKSDCTSVACLDAVTVEDVFRAALQFLSL